MKHIWYLSTCSTCQKILLELQPGPDVTLQDIKTDKITAEQIDRMKQLAGSYEALFSRKAMKYKSMGLDKEELVEKDYRDLILSEYTFLKRPVAIIGDRIFVGNTKGVVEQLRQALREQ
jgi:arsenate reductase (glutaredoxin)